jgi:hypothetical protein
VGLNLGRGKVGKGMNELVKGPSSVERPRAFPPFIAIFSMIFKERGWTANAGAKPDIFSSGAASSTKICITSLMSVASFLNVTVLNLLLSSALFPSQQKYLKLIGIKLTFP